MSVYSIIRDGVCQYRRSVQAVQLHRVRAFERMEGPLVGLTVVAGRTAGQMLAHGRRAQPGAEPPADVHARRLVRPALDRLAAALPHAEPGRGRAPCGSGHGSPNFLRVSTIDRAQYTQSLVVKLRTVYSMNIDLLSL